jgi:hypothetical protein
VQGGEAEREERGGDDWWISNVSYGYIRLDSGSWGGGGGGGGGGERRKRDNTRGKSEDV